MKEVTLEQFEAIAGKPFVQAALRRAAISEDGTYKEFVEQLYEDVDSAIFALQASRELRQNDGEDRITQDLLIALGQQGYLATHDGKSGGHVDLSVRLGNHSWIAEAKKDGQFEEGLRQLTRRYVQASGNYAHNHAGLLLYMVKTSDALGSLKRWRSKASAYGHACTSCKRNVLAFYSSHKLVGSGTKLTVRNMAVSLHHEPTDKSARLSAAKKAANAKP